VAFPSRHLDHADPVPIAYEEALREMEFCSIPTRTATSTFPSHGICERTPAGRHDTISRSQQSICRRHGHLYGLPDESQCRKHKDSSDCPVAGYDDRLGSVGPSSSRMHETGSRTTKRCDSLLRLSQTNTHSVRRCILQAGSWLEEFVLCQQVRHCAPVLLA
jgi:hypothetical protein